MRWQVAIFLVNSPNISQVLYIVSQTLISNKTQRIKKGDIMFAEMLENVRKQAPLIHCITNYVTVNDVANMVLAVGASPIMADDAKEVEEITSICQGLTVNIGTLNERTISSMLLAGKKANMMGHKVLLDPVGAGASRLRTDTANILKKEVHFDVIRGNISEIKTLADGSKTTSGVDANKLDKVTKDNLKESIAFAKSFAEETGSVIAITGEIDLVTDGKKCFVLTNGTKFMSSITGTGCQLSALATAFISANPTETLLAAATAVGAMGLAGEIAFSKLSEGEGNATYRNYIIDAVCGMNPERLEKGVRYEIY